jgi:hypothetical protein
MAFALLVIPEFAPSTQYHGLMVSLCDSGIRWLTM